jgi:Type ISP C-terminal specificity domain
LMVPGNADVAAVWWHALAIAYSPEWLEENQDAIVQDWPRVPMPLDPEQLRASANLGKRIADLLDPDVAVSGVTAGAIEPALRLIAVLTKAGGGAANGEDFALIARWGALDSSRKVMPGPGKFTQRDYSAAEGACADQASMLGERTFDIYLNTDVFWRNVPSEVWDFTVGGFQPLKKWLSYRERVILDRALSITESGYFRDTARRLAKIRLLGPELDANFRACADAAYAWRSPPPVPNSPAIIADGGATELNN